MTESVNGRHSVVSDESTEESARPWADLPQNFETRNVQSQISGGQHDRHLKWTSTYRMEVVSRAVAGDVYLVPAEGEVLSMEGLSDVAYEL